MNLKSTFNLKELQTVLASNPKIVITTHTNPDGDAVGSLLALYNFFITEGFQVSAITPNEYPTFLQWLPRNAEVIDYSQNKQLSAEIIANAGLIFQLDYNDNKRAGEMNEVLANSTVYKVMIDHHPFPQLKNNLMISVIESSSTAELIFEFIIAIKGIDAITRDISECIYTGIMTDTGCFNYNSSRPRTFEIVAELLRKNIRKDEIFRQVFDNYSEYRLRLLGYCLSEKMQVFSEYKCAIMSISLEDQEIFKFTTGDSEGFVNYPLSIKGIVFTAFFTERKDKVKISFRSKGSFPANVFAEKYFGGGGHLNAAGGESLLSLSETIEKFIQLLPSFQQYLPL